MEENKPTEVCPECKHKLIKIDDQGDGMRWVGFKCSKCSYIDEHTVPSPNP